jgi:hypothetical protein
MAIHESTGRRARAVTIYTCTHYSCNGIWSTAAAVMNWVCYHRGADAKSFSQRIAARLLIHKCDPISKNRRGAVLAFYECRANFMGRVKFQVH